MNRSPFRLALLAGAALSFAACAPEEEADVEVEVEPTRSTASLTGAGASFPFPLYSRMFNEYEEQTGVQVNYQSIGSGAGQNQIIAQTVDFGASDNPVSDELLERAPGTLLHVPTALGAVVPTYNVPGVEEPLRLSGEVLADIYLGEITTWDDPAIAELNPDVTLPPLPITVVRRSDASGTTNVWTEFLAATSPEFQEQVGAGSAVSWPVGLGAKGNEGVAGIVKSTPGALGYNELVYASQNELQYAAVRNQAGEFILADPESVTAAAAQVELPEDLRVSITNAPGEESYPIASYTYVLAYEDQQYGNRTETTARALKDMLEWMVTEGQQYNEPLDYAQLPDDVQARTLEVIERIRYGEEPLE